MIIDGKIKYQPIYVREYMEYGFVEFWNFNF